MRLHSFPTRRSSDLRYGAVATLAFRAWCSRRVRSSLRAHGGPGRWRPRHARTDVGGHLAPMAIFSRRQTVASRARVAHRRRPRPDDSRGPLQGTPRAGLLRRRVSSGVGSVRAGLRGLCQSAGADRCDLVPGTCPVIVRSACPPLRRILELMGLEDCPGQAGRAASARPCRRAFAREPRPGW